MNRKEAINKGLLEDCELTDVELLDKLNRLLGDFFADPFNGYRRIDHECQQLLIHAGERCRSIWEIQNGSQG